MNSGICRLCREEGELKNSHIIPEFFYRPTYDEKHRTFAVTPAQPGVTFLQKGLRQRLLCETCEGRLQVFEDYFAYRWIQQAALPDTLEGEYVLLQDLDYRQSKLFLLSILWRAAVSSLDAFGEVSLGPHSERLRSALLSGEPGSWSTYPVYGSVLVYARTNEVLKQAVITPRRMRLGPHTVYQFVFGGVAWNYLVSSHSHDRFEQLSIRENGTLILFRLAPGQLHTVAELSRTGRIDELLA